MYDLIKVHISICSLPNKIDLFQKKKRKEKIL